MQNQIDDIAGRTISFDRSHLVDVDLFGGVKQRPQELFVEWSQKPPFYIEDGGFPLAVCTRHGDCKEAFEDFDRFSSVKRPWPGLERFRYFLGLPVITDADPPNHTRMRRFMAPAFSPRRLAAMEADLRVYVDKRLDEFEARGEGGFDAASEFGRALTANVLLGMLLGLAEEDWHIFLDIGHLMSGFNTMRAGSAPSKDFVEAFARGRAYCEKLADDRRKRPRDDVITSLVAAHDEGGRLDAEEMFATMFVMYIGGQGGVANTPAFALWRLCRDRSQIDLLREQPELIANAVDEAIRTDSNAYVLLRHATRDQDFHSLPLLKDMPVIIVSCAPNFDPTRYEDPLRYDIRRVAPRDIVTFGHGVHHCIGMSMARMVGRIAVGSAVKRFPKLRLKDQDLWPEITGGPKERGVKSIPLRFD